MNFEILVMSCDRYSKYTFEMFHHCIEKYWENHPKVYYCTESVKNPYYETINVDCPASQWTKRVYESLKHIDSDIVLVCPDDTFFRKKVNNRVLHKLCDYIDNKLIAINLEPPFDCIPCNEILSIRNPQGKWLTSFMPQLWNKNKLMELLKDKELNPRQAEKIGYGTNYSYGIIATTNTDIDFGKKPNVYPYAIVEGKWEKEMIDFCKQENVDIDFSELGFFEGKGK
jgi:hypothetical protein